MEAYVTDRRDFLKTTAAAAAVLAADGLLARPKSAAAQPLQQQP